MINKKSVILIIACVILLGEISYSLFKGSGLNKEYNSKILLMKLSHEQRKKALSDEFEKNKYMATGKTAYDRIFNKKDQNIEDLIVALAKEAFPEGWSFATKVEEFTNFILLIQPPLQSGGISINETFKRLSGILLYTDPFLKNVAIFNKNHVCDLYLDENMLDVISKNRGEATGQQILDIENQGRAFKNYNSVRIEFQNASGHMIVPVIVSGDRGVSETKMLVDTGASMTIISLELAQRTGSEDLNRVKRQEFSTAKGRISCPIVKRKLIIGGIETFQEIAVNPNDNQNLLGVDYFRNKNYVVDNVSNSIYIWPKNDTVQRLMSRGK